MVTEDSIKADNLLSLRLEPTVFSGGFNNLHAALLAIPPENQFKSYWYFFQGKRLCFELEYHFHPSEELRKLANETKWVIRGQPTGLTISFTPDYLRTFKRDSLALQKLISGEHHEFYNQTVDSFLNIECGDDQLSLQPAENQQTSNFLPWMDANPENHQLSLADEAQDDAVKKFFKDGIAIVYHLDEKIKDSELEKLFFVLENKDAPIDIKKLRENPTHKLALSKLQHLIFLVRSLEIPLKQLKNKKLSVETAQALVGLRQDENRYELVRRVLKQDDYLDELCNHSVERLRENQIERLNNTIAEQKAAARAHEEELKKVMQERDAAREELKIAHQRANSAADAAQEAADAAKLTVQIAQQDRTTMQAQIFELQKQLAAAQNSLHEEKNKPIVQPAPVIIREVDETKILDLQQQLINERCANANLHKVINNNEKINQNEILKLKEQNEALKRGPERVSVGVQTKAVKEPEPEKIMVEATDTQSTPSSTTTLVKQKKKKEPLPSFDNLLADALKEIDSIVPPIIVVPQQETLLPILNKEDLLTKYKKYIIQKLFALDYKTHFWNKRSQDIIAKIQDKFYEELKLPKEDKLVLEKETIHVPRLLAINDDDVASVDAFKLMSIICDKLSNTVDLTVKNLEIDVVEAAKKIVEVSIIQSSDAYNIYRLLGPAIQSWAKLTQQEVPSGKEYFLKVAKDTDAAFKSLPAPKDPIEDKIELMKTATNQVVELIMNDTALTYIFQKGEYKPLMLDMCKKERRVFWATRGDLVFEGLKRIREAVKSDARFDQFFKDAVDHYYLNHSTSAPKQLLIRPIADEIVKIEAKAHYDDGSVMVISSVDVNSKKSFRKK